MRIVTHSGSFHSDDVFAIAALFLKFGKEHELIRTRDPEIIAGADIVVDVGQEYDEARLRFDHHQGPPLRDNGVPYAAFGLVWKRFGSEICGSEELSVRVDRRLVQPIDAADNSVDVVIPAVKGLSPYLIQDIVKSMRPTWLEEQDFDKAFLAAVALAVIVIERQIAKAKAEAEGNRALERFYAEADDKRVLAMDKLYPDDEFLSAHSDVLFTVYPDNPKLGTWSAKTVAAKESSYESRKDFPEEWAGKRDSDLAAVTGVPDAVFCHLHRFIAIAKSKEGAVKLAQLAADA